MTVAQLVHFARMHDDLPAFHAAYILLTLVSAAVFNLGVFALLILVHMILDIIKYHDIHQLSWRGIMEGVFRESLIDITLFFVGLTFALYLHSSIPVIAGLSGIARAQITLLRGFGTLIPKFFILQHLLKVLAHFQHYLHVKHSRLGKKLSEMEFACTLFLAVTFTLLFLSPVVLPFSVTEIREILRETLLPWSV